MLVYLVSFYPTKWLRNFAGAPNFHPTKWLRNFAGAPNFHPKNSRCSFSGAPYFLSHTTIRWCISCLRHVLVIAPLLRRQYPSTPSTLSTPHLHWALRRAPLHRAGSQLRTTHYALIQTVRSTAPTHSVAN
jgi:hypothetical protein